MGRKSIKEVRQREIVKVFYKVAKREGLENTSIALIAKEMSINPSLIIHYFQTKNDLTYALIEYILEKYKLIFKIKSQESSKDILKELVDNLFSKKWNKLFDDSLFYSCYAISFRDAKTREMYKNLLDSLRQNLAKILALCDENDSDTLVEVHIKKADAFFAILDGAYFYLSLIEDKKEYEERLLYYRTIANQLLGF